MINLPRVSFLLLVLLLLASGDARTQVMTSSDNYALIFPRSGDGFASNILRIDPDTVIVYTKDYKYIAKKDIGKIILHPKHESGRAFTIGSVVGMYVMNYWLGTANKQSGSFLWNDIYGSKYGSTNSSGTLPGVAIALAGIAVGGGVGYLFDLGHEANEETIFIFGGSPEMQKDEWQKIEQRFNHKMTHGKFHLDVSGGVLFPPASNAYYNQLSAAGYDMSSFSTSFSRGFFEFGNSTDPSTTNLAPYQSMQVPTDFNWLRSIALSYSVTENIEVGLSYALLGQPSFVYSKDITTIDQNDSFPTQSFATAFVGQRVNGKGYYATAGYEIFFGKDQNIEASVTAGVGVASMTFDLNGQYDFFSSSTGFNSVQQDNVSFSKTYFSGMLSAGVSYYLYDSFSLGLKVNYFHIGKYSARAMPFVFLDPQDINFSSADVGFTVGIHF
ncbi:MAG: hypothetical protein Q8896_08650 [Bacteroidota bacterium]|nr:hypothetical protein [Bacteroidota bacterium]